MFLFSMAIDCGDVESFNIIDADSDDVYLGPIKPDSSNVATVEVPIYTGGDLENFNLEAVVGECPADYDYYKKIESVELCYIAGPDFADYEDRTGPGFCLCEDEAPYAMFSNRGADFFGKTLLEGCYEITAQSFTEKKCGGGGSWSGTIKTLKFCVEKPKPPTDAPVVPPTDAPVVPPTGKCGKSLENRRATTPWCHFLL